MKKIFLEIIIILLFGLSIFFVLIIKTQDGKIRKLKDNLSELKKENNTLNALMEKKSAAKKQSKTKSDELSETELSETEIYEPEEYNIENISSEDVKQDLIKHPDIIPYKGVVGGTMAFYDEKAIKVLNSRWVIAEFEDGHLLGSAILRYKVKNNKITWEVVDSFIE